MKIYVFLHDGYADWEIGYLLPQLVDSKQDVVTFGLTRDSVRSMGGLRVTPDIALSEIDESGIRALVLPGGTHWEKFSNPDLDRLVRECVVKKTLLAAICAGTGYLGRLGVLDQVRHTSNPMGFLPWFAPQYRGQALYEDSMAVLDQSILTSPGVGAIEFAAKFDEALSITPKHLVDLWVRAFKYGEVEPFERALMAESHNQPK